jgi:hypothetical protein
MHFRRLIEFENSIFSLVPQGEKYFFHKFSIKKYIQGVYKKPEFGRFFHVIIIDFYSKKRQLTRT